MHRGMAVSSRPQCPRCGAVRLIARRAILQRPRLRDGVPLALYLRRRFGRGGGEILRSRYVCEMCRHTWRTDEWLTAAG